MQTPLYSIALVGAPYTPGLLFFKRAAGKVWFTPVGSLRRVLDRVSFVYFVSLSTRSPSTPPLLWQVLILFPCSYLSLDSLYIQIVLW